MTAQNDGRGLAGHSLDARLQPAHVLVFHDGGDELGILFQHLQAATEPGTGVQRAAGDDEQRWPAKRQGGGGSQHYSFEQGCMPGLNGRICHTCWISTVVRMRFDCVWAAGCAEAIREMLCRQPGAFGVQNQDA